MFQLTYTSPQGDTFWLGGTVWRFCGSRASIYLSAEEAQAALDRAARFMSHKVYKAARIVDIS